MVSTTADRGRTPATAIPPRMPCRCRADGPVSRPARAPRPADRPSRRRLRNVPIHPSGRWGLVAGTATSAARDPACDARRVDGHRVDALDRRTEDGLEARRERPRQRQLLARVRCRQRPVPRVAQERPRIRGRQHARGIRLPMYSSSVPPMANGTTGAPVRSAMMRPPMRNGPRRPGGPRPSLRASGRTRPVRDDRARRGDVLRRRRSRRATPAGGRRASGSAPHASGR